MKTEQQIIDSIEKVRKSLHNDIDNISELLIQEKYDQASEACFTVLVNINALEAAKRIIE